MVVHLLPLYQLQHRFQTFVHPFDFLVTARPENLWEFLQIQLGSFFQIDDRFLNRRSLAYCPDLRALRDVAQLRAMAARY